MVLSFLESQWYRVVGAYSKVLNNHTELVGERVGVTSGARVSGPRAHCMLTAGLGIAIKINVTKRGPKLQFLNSCRNVGASMLLQKESSILNKCIQTNSGNFFYFINIYIINYLFSSFLSLGALNFLITNDTFLGINAGFSISFFSSRIMLELICSVILLA